MMMIIIIILLFFLILFKCYFFSCFFKPYFFLLLPKDNHFFLLFFTATSTSSTSPPICHQDSKDADVQIGVCAVGLLIFKERLREHRWVDVEMMCECIRLEEGRTRGWKYGRCEDHGSESKRGNGVSGYYLKT